MKKLAWSLITTLLICVMPSNAQNIVQPGAPGSGSTYLTADQAIQIAKTNYSLDDVLFMQDMIPHHEQALEMSLLSENRTNSPDILEVSGRIKASQEDEIDFMKQWLIDRGESITSDRGELHHHGTTTMRGMATPEQMSRLTGLTGSAFNRQFLTLMIAHHEGALEMVEALIEKPGAAYDPTLFEFTTSITNDQSNEIKRMHELLVGLSDDPRANLKPGLFAAEEAIWNLRKIASLGKPAGFFDPANPADLPPERFLGKTTSESESAPKRNLEPETPEDKKEGDADKPEPRQPLMSFSNTDIAFRDDVMVAGSYHGFNIYRLGKEGIPELQASVVCPGGQGDVSIVDDLLIMSVEEQRGRLDCGLEGIQEEVSEDRFRGIRIFDIKDLKRPVQVGAVQTCRGSHTHSVVSGPEPDNKLIIYNSGTSRVRDEVELEGCIDESPGDDRTALFRIDVIEIPIDNPSQARIVDSPAVFANPETGALGGLWRGGDHGDGTQETRPTDQCHDITVFPKLSIAAGACSGNGILFDISDPLAPERLDAVNDKRFAYWHSATFNNDGSKVLFTDEWGGGTRPRCRAYDPLDWGANAIYDIVDNKLIFRSYFKMPAPQLETENCVAHNGSIIPVPGRDIFVQAWYQGGISILDFTDSRQPVEIAFFDRGPIDAEDLVTGGYWSTYWYGGRIYGTEITRGIDVFALTPSEFLTKSEISAAELANHGSVFNPQQQFPFTWPAEPIVARAQVDQLARLTGKNHAQFDLIHDLLNRASEVLKEQAVDPKLALDLAQLAGSEPITKSRDLVSSLEAIATRLSEVR